MTGQEEQPGTLLPWVIGLVLVSAAFVNPLDFAAGTDYERATSSTSLLTLAKLGVAAVATLVGALGLLFSPRTRRLINTVPGAALVALGVVFFLTSFVATPEVRTISIASSLIYFGYLLFLLTAMATIGCRRVVACLVGGTALYLLLTWGVFVLIPEQGRFTEYTSATDSVTRMGGTGHPNHIAKTAVAGGLMGVALLLGRSIGVQQPWWRLVLMGVVVLVAATCLATFSRTAILAGIAAGGVMLIDRLYGRGGLAVVVASLAGVSALILVIALITGEGPFSKSAVGVVTKSGDVEELTSLTGRTTIWGEAIGLIAQRPLTGWGLDSAATVMSKRATGTHNLVLHVFFSAGVLAAVLIVVLLVWSLIFGATSRHDWIRGVMAFVLISGLVEDTILESFPTIITLLWITALLAPTLAAPDTSPRYAPS
ncbi:O-antigen ligase family protein [Neorhodopirellula pilleata]|uniref:O-Antigen ligase n=1 Tax=Neorhodopirellula pilleata TaxID=2714738 RepID=A0A5C6A8S8_9BACT|nr:O-antigen ligase family protein [Neorhodopirellula pilleata]TWT95705.1 O-Antigen ligase [Neorhodopirellula pilleata]